MILFGRVVDIKGWLRRRLRWEKRIAAKGKKATGKWSKPVSRMNSAGIVAEPDDEKSKEQKIMTMFLLSFLIGVVAVNLCGANFAERFEMLTADRLVALRDAVIDGELFFKQLLLRRGMILCGIIGVTVIRPGKWLCRVIIAWLGFAFGSFFAALSLLYGLKGQFLGLAWCLPQGIAYGPAFVFLMKWCEQLHEMIHAGHLSVRSAEGRRAFAWKSAEFAGIISLLSVGCLLEGYLNPIFLQFCLRHF